MIHEFEVEEHMLKEKCQVCRKKFKSGEKIILCPIQAPAGEGYYINALSIPIHRSCYFVEDKG